MTGATLGARWEGLDQVRSAFRKMERLGKSPESLLKPIGAFLTASTKDRFLGVVGPDGQRWPSLSPAYLGFKQGPKIMVASGGLRKSVHARVEGTELAVGTNKEYAAIHQFGGVIRPKKPGGVLIFRDAKGNPWGAARQVTMPARPYLGISAADQEEILATVELRLLQARNARRGS